LGVAPNIRSSKLLSVRYSKRAPGGIAKAEGLGDGLTHGKVAIAKLRLTMPRRNPH
jgi:hypothetical protein